MEEQSNTCVFRDILNTCNINKELAGKELTVKQKNKISECSKERKDNYRLNEVETLHFHTNCYADYTSTVKIKHHLEKQKNTQKDEVIPAKRLRRCEKFIL